VSAQDSGDADEGSVKVTQVQGLRACGNAWIAVPSNQFIELIASLAVALDYALPRRFLFHPTLLKLLEFLDHLVERSDDILMSRTSAGPAYDDSFLAGLN
jgi:hypothetical protein